MKHRGRWLIIANGRTAEDVTYPSLPPQQETTTSCSPGGSPRVDASFWALRFTSPLSPLAVLVTRRRPVAHGCMPSCQREHAFFQICGSQYKYFVQSLHGLVFETQKSLLFQFENLKFGFVYQSSQERSQESFINISNYEAAVHISTGTCILTTIMYIVLRGGKTIYHYWKFSCVLVCDFVHQKSSFSLWSIKDRGFFLQFTDRET